MNLIFLFEDVFMDKLRTIYYNRLKDRLGDEMKPDDFDEDALRLGVMHEMEKNHKKMKVALVLAMRNLKQDPHFYDDLDDFNGVVGSNQIAFPGSGFGRIRM